jgi:hypothetical protein
MRKLILLVGLFAFHQITYGQCEKKVILKSNNMRGLKYGSVTKEMAVEASISIDKEKIVLTASKDGMTETVDCEIKEVVICDWKEYLKDGKAQFKVLGKKGSENPTSSIVDIESANGYTKVTFGLDPDTTGSKLQFDISEYSITEDTLPNNPPSKTEQKQKKTKRKSKADTK